MSGADNPRLKASQVTAHSAHDSGGCGVGGDARKFVLSLEVRTSGKVSFGSATCGTTRAPSCSASSWLAFRGLPKRAQKTKLNADLGALGHAAIARCCTNNRWMNCEPAVLLAAPAKGAAPGDSLSTSTSTTTKVHNNNHNHNHYYNHNHNHNKNSSSSSSPVHRSLLQMPISRD